MYGEDLAVLKLCNNKIDTLDELKCLKDLKALLKLDLTGNKVCEVENYTEKVFEMLPTLEVLDCQDKEGEFVESDDDDEDYGEEGELDLEDDLLAQLDEDTKQRLRDGKMNAEELEALGLDPALLDADEGEEEEQSEAVEEGEGEEKKEEDD